MASSSSDDCAAATAARACWTMASTRGCATKLSALGFSGLGELRELQRIGDRQLRQHLAIEVDAGLLERRHELRVREPHLATRRVDPHDPERPRLALLLLAAAVGEGARAQHRFGGGLVELATSAEVALRLLEDLLAPSARLRSTFCPWHSPTPPRSWRAPQAVGAPPPAEARLGTIDRERAPAAGPRPLCRSACPCAAGGGAWDPCPRACAASSR